MADVYWVSTEGPVILLSVCLPPLLPLGRHIKANYLSPMASSISRTRLRNGSSSGRFRSHTGDFLAGTPSVYRGADLEQAQQSTTKLFPSRRELESLHKIPSPEDTRSDSPRLTQPQIHYAARVKSTDNTTSAPLAVPECSIRVDSDFIVSPRPW